MCALDLLHQPWPLPRCAPRPCLLLQLYSGRQASARDGLPHLALAHCLRILLSHRLDRLQHRAERRRARPTGVVRVFDDLGGARPHRACPCDLEPVGEVDRRRPRCGPRTFANANQARRFSSPLALNTHPQHCFASCGPGDARSGPPTLLLATDHPNPHLRRRPTRHQANLFRTACRCSAHRAPVT